MTENHDTASEYMTTRYMDNPIYLYTEQQIFEEFIQFLEDLEDENNELETVAETIDDTEIDDTEVELIDLQDITGQVTVDYAISRNTGFNNEVYFYQVDDITGAVNGLYMSNYDYISSAFTTFNNDTKNGSTKLDSSLIAPWIVADCNLKQAQNCSGNVYTVYLSAKSDDALASRAYPASTCSFENWSNGKDRNFNDILTTLLAPLITLPKSMVLESNTLSVF